VVHVRALLGHDPRRDGAVQTVAASASATLGPAKHRQRDGVPDRRTPKTVCAGGGWPPSAANPNCLRSGTHSRPLNPRRAQDRRFRRVAVHVARGQQLLYVDLHDIIGQVEARQRHRGDVRAGVGRSSAPRPGFLRQRDARVRCAIVSILVGCTIERRVSVSAAAPAVADFRLTFQGLEENVLVAGEIARAAVEAQRALIPGGVTVIDGDELFSRVNNMTDMWRFVPGMFAGSGYGNEELFFSGRGSNLDAVDYDKNGIKLLQDGPAARQQ
jgi:hypothetical protein